MCWICSQNVHHDAEIKWLSKTGWVSTLHPDFWDLLGSSQIHKYGQLIIKSAKLPKPLLMVPNKHLTLRLEESRSPGGEGDGTRDRKLDLSHGCVLSGRWTPAFAGHVLSTDITDSAGEAVYLDCLCWCENVLCAQWWSDRRLKHLQMFVWLLPPPHRSLIALWERHLYVHYKLTETSSVANGGLENTVKQSWNGKRKRLWCFIQPCALASALCNSTSDRFSRQR